MNKVLTTFCLAGTLAGTGCATIVSDSKYPVTINSTPPGATVLVRNEQGIEMHKLQTPATIPLDAGDGYFSKAQYTIEFQKEGYQSSTATLAATLDPWYIGNIIFGGLIGLLIIDPVTGSMWQLDENLLAGMTPDPNAPPVTIPLTPAATTDTAPAAC